MAGPLGTMHRHERAGALSGFLTLGGILASHTVLETARDAMFLAGLPPERLPWVYLIIAVVGMLGARSPLVRLSRPSHLSAALLGSAGLTATLWVLTWWVDAAWLLYVIYVWSGLFATLIVVQFWLITDRAYTITEAKRVFGLIGAGSITGAILGAVLARMLTGWLPTRHLLLAATGLLLVSSLGPPLLARWLQLEADGADSQEAMSLRECMERMAEHPYIRRVGWLVLTATLTFTLVDYVFKTVVAQTIEPSQLGSFFATLNIGLNAGSLLAQTLLVRWLLTTLSLPQMLSVLPILLAAGGLAVATGGGLVAGLFLKAPDGSLRHSLHRTATELLYVPMSDETRSGAKLFIDVLGQRGGQALASLGILAAVSWLGPSPQELAVATSILALLWLAIAWGLRAPYLELFRETLDRESVRTRIDFPSLDLTSLETLISRLNSTDDEEVAAVLDLLEQQGKSHLIPDLILYHPSRRVVLLALDIFSRERRESALPILNRLLRHGDPEVRAAALRARSWFSPELSVLEAALRDPSARVVATALVGIATVRGDIDDGLKPRFEDVVESDDDEARWALARAIRQHPHRVFHDVLLRLAGAAAPEVRSEVAHAMAALPALDYIPALLPMLGERHTRQPAREALVAMGPAALERLDVALDDPALPSRVRQHIPRTISRFEPRRCAPILLDHLVRDPDGIVRFKLLRGLGRVRAKDPDVPLDEGILDEATRSTLGGAFRALHWRLELQRGAEAQPAHRTPVHGLLVDLLRDREHHALERAFRLLGLQHPRDDLEHIYRGLRGHNPRAEASGRELLSSVVEPPIRDPLLALVDRDLDDATKLHAAPPMYRPHELSYEATLAEILEHSGESLRCIAAYHAGEQGLRTLRPRLEALQDTGSEFVTEAVRRALELMDDPAPERLAYVS